jgi:hypothetical protein
MTGASKPGGQRFSATSYSHDRGTTQDVDHSIQPWSLDFGLVSSRTLNTEPCLPAVAGTLHAIPHRLIRRRRLAPGFVGLQCHLTISGIPGCLLQGIHEDLPDAAPSPPRPHAKPMHDGNCSNGRFPNRQRYRADRLSRRRLSRFRKPHPVRPPPGLHQKLASKIVGIPLPHAHLLASKRLIAEREPNRNISLPAISAQKDIRRRYARRPNV